MTAPWTRTCFEIFWQRKGFFSFSPPVPNSIIAFSYVNMTAMDKDRRKWTFCLASALCIKPLSSGAPLAPVIHFKTDFVVPTPLGPRLEEEHVCFYLVCVLALPQKMLTKGNLLAADFSYTGVEIMWKKQTWYNLRKVNNRKTNGLPHCTGPAPRALPYESVPFPRLFWLRSCH